MRRRSVENVITTWKINGKRDRRIPRERFPDIPLPHLYHIRLYILMWDRNVKWFIDVGWKYKVVH